MNTIDCIKTRRSVRKYRNEQIKDDELIQVLEAGTWSPTSMGAQHPHIVAVQNPAFIERLKKMNAVAAEASCSVFTSPEVCVLYQCSIASPMKFTF